MYYVTLGSNRKDARLYPCLFSIQAAERMRTTLDRFSSHSDDGVVS